MGDRAKGKKVAILVADGFEDAEFFDPKKALEDEGAQVEVVSLKTDDIQAFRHMEKSRTAKVDKAVKDARVEDYDALFIPGGLYNPDHLRADKDAVDFARAFMEQKKPVGAICHGPQVLITARVVNGRAMTAYKTVQPDLELAGAHVTDEEVVVDKGLVTSRNPDDIPAFNKKLIEEIAEGSHAGRKAA